MCRPTIPDDYVFIKTKLEDWRHPQIIRGSNSTRKVFDLLYESLGTVGHMVREAIDSSRKEHTHYRGDYSCVVDGKPISFKITDIVDKFQLEVDWEDMTVSWSIIYGE